MHSGARVAVRGVVRAGAREFMPLGLAAHRARGCAAALVGSGALPLDAPAARDTVTALLAEADVTTAATSPEALELLRAAVQGALNGGPTRAGGAASGSGDDDGGGGGGGGGGGDDESGGGRRGGGGELHGVVILPGC